MSKGNSNAVANIVSFLSFLFCVAGVIGAITGMPVLVYVGAGVSLFASLINVIFGDQNNLTTEIITIIIGVIIALVASANLIYAIGLALCIGDIIMTVFGWISVATMYRKYN